MKKTLILISSIMILLSIVMVSCSPSGSTKDIVTVKYDLNGGEGTVPEDQTIEFDENGDSKEQYKPNPYGDIVRDGYSLSSWNTKADGTGIDFFPNSSRYVSKSYFTINGNKETYLYANWLKVEDHDGILYQEIDSDSYAVVSLSESGKSMTEITVPEKINGKTVTTILPRAFMNETKIEKITLPDTIKEIGTKVFAFCYNLKSVNIPKNVKKIESTTFWCCEALENIEIPGNIEEIGVQAFENCENLKNVTINSGVQAIENWAFRGCKALTEISIPNSVESLGYYCFEESDNLVTINIDKSEGELEGAPWGAPNPNVKVNYKK